MYSSEDLERFYFQYQTEAMPKGISIEQFCSRNKVPYNIFYKWYKDTRNKIVEVKVDGLPASCQKDPKEEAHLPEQSRTEVAKTEHSHPLGMVVSTHFRCGKGVKRGLKNGALPFNID